METAKPVKALETGKEAKQGVVAKAVPNAFQGVKAQAGIPDGAPQGNNASLNQAGAKVGSTTPSKTASSSEIDAYRSILQRALQQRANNAYPQREKMMRKTGVVTLRFTITPSGQITNVSVANSSGNENLDAAAVKAAQATNPPSPPAGFPSSVSVPIRFAIQ